MHGSWKPLLVSSLALQSAVAAILLRESAYQVASFANGNPNFNVGFPSSFPNRKPIGLNEMIPSVQFSVKSRNQRWEMDACSLSPRSARKGPDRRETSAPALDRLSACKTRYLAVWSVLAKVGR